MNRPQAQEARGVSGTRGMLHVTTEQNPSRTTCQTPDLEIKWNKLEYCLGKGQGDSRK